MEVKTTGLLVPARAASVRIGERTVLLNPRNRWPIFEAGAKETKGIEHMLVPLTADYEAPAAKRKKDEEPPAAPAADEA